MASAAQRRGLEPAFCFPARHYTRVDPLVLIALALAGFSGAILAGITGWGGWILPGALAWLVVDPYVALVMSCPFALGVDFTLLLRERRSVDLRAAGRLAAWIVPGLTAGTLLLTVIDQQLLRLVAGGLILAGALPSLWSLLAGRAAVGGLAAGVFTMVGGFNGPPLGLALAGLDARARRGTLGLLFCGLAVVGLGLMLIADVPTGDWRRGLILGGALAPLASLGTLVGIRLSDRHLPVQTFALVARALCLAAGALLIVRGI